MHTWVEKAAERI